MLQTNGVIKCTKDIKNQYEDKIFREKRMYRYWQQNDNYVVCDDMNQLHVIKERQGELNKFFYDHFEIIS